MYRSAGSLPAFFIWVMARTKQEKPDPGFPPRRRDPSDRATAPDFRASLGKWARKSGCAVFRMTVICLRAKECQPSHFRKKTYRSAGSLPAFLFRAVVAEKRRLAALRSSGQASVTEDLLADFFGAI
jgi:hypothetical protein